MLAAQVLTPVSSDRPTRSLLAKAGTASAGESELRDLMTMATHDLKSPLAAAATNLEMLREDNAGRLGGDGEQCLRAAERALRRMDDLVEDLLAYATADQRAVALRPVSLAEEIAKQVAGEVSVRGPLPAVQADPKLLRHVLDNLISNAAKYTPPGSPARIEISARLCSGGMVRVEVADRGIGIPEADRSRVFDAFHRSANSGAYRGTGLGLAICRRIVERHGGRIGVEENAGGGSRFWFTLPGSLS
jgi:signal transduction histidine kinase